MELFNTGKKHHTIPSDEERDTQIEKVKIFKGSVEKTEASENLVLFFLEGRLKICVGGYADREAIKGQIVLLPAGETVCCQALADTGFIVFRIPGSGLCEHLPADLPHLETPRRSDPLPETKYLPLLDINPRLWHFIDGLHDCLNDGVRCKPYFKLKVNEFFQLLYLYYPRTKIHDFLYPVMSRDTVFSEYVRRAWKQCRNVQKFAQGINMSPKQFSRKFVDIFGMTPYKWMKQARARCIYHELRSTAKPFKVIADDHGFNSVQHFNMFVKAEFGKTPNTIRLGDTQNGNNAEKNVPHL